MEKTEISQKDKTKIRHRCRMRIARKAKRLGKKAYELRDEYEECITIEMEAFRRGKIQKRERVVTAEDILEYRQKVAREKAEAGDPWEDPAFEQEMIDSLNRIWEDPERKRWRKKQIKKIIKEIEEGH